MISFCLTTWTSCLAPQWRSEITRKILQQDTEILHVSVIVWSRMRIWPGCLQSTRCLFRNDWKVFENFKVKFKYFFSTEHKEETKLNKQNSTGPHTEIGFVKHNEILPCSLSMWFEMNAREISNFQSTWPLFKFEEARRVAFRFMTAQRKRLMAQIWWFAPDFCSSFHRGYF